jgi:hypothetical protein
VIAEHIKGIGVHPNPVLLNVHDLRYPLQSAWVANDYGAKIHSFL